MKIMKTSIVILLTVMFAVYAYSDDKYEVQDHSQLMVEVKGVVCSFCAYGTEKNLARLKFVDPKFFGGDGVLLDLKKASITLALQANQKIDIADIAKAIEKGGYVPVAVHLKLAGPIVRENQELFIRNKMSGQLFLLLDVTGQPWKDESYLGKEVNVQGVIPLPPSKKSNASAAPAVRIKQLK